MTQDLRTRALAQLLNGPSRTWLTDTAFVRGNMEYLLERIEKLEKALEFYADEISYAVTQIGEPRSAVHGDRGARARAALREIQPPRTLGP